MKKIIYVLTFFLLAQALLGNIYSNAQQVQILNEEKAHLLKNLGIFKGSNNGFELERSPSRIEGAVILVRLLGKEKDSLELKLPHPFQDVPEWASPYIGYMYQNKLTNGKSDIEFGSNDILSLQQFTTFVLRALEYQDGSGDFQWDKSVDKAKEIGLFSEQETARLTKKESFIRDDIVGICFDALKTNLKGKEISLLYKLVYEEKCIAVDLAEDSGLLGDSHKVFENSVPPEDVQEVVFKDKEFEKLVRDAIHKPQGEILYKDVRNISHIKIENKTLSTLEGIEFMRGLNILHIKNSNISDPALIGQLTNLRELSIYNCNMVDISFLSGLVNLENLTLNENKISDISALENMMKLDWLYLYKNKISDLSPIRNLTNLQDLVIAYNEIQDLSPLSNLTNLTYLYAGDNRIESLEPLRGLNQLTALFLPNNQIADITPVGSLIELTELDISNNQVKDINSLKDTKRIKLLNINGNQIQDLSSLQNMKGLEELYAQKNGFSDISVLSNKSKLEYADLGFNKIKNLPSMKELICLKSMNLMGNEIQDISALADVGHMSGWIELSINNIQDIKALSGFDQLTGLFLTGNSISDITSIGTMRNLKTLDLRGNKISDLSALKALALLENLYLSRNPITDYSAVKGYYSILKDKDFDVNVPDITTRDPSQLTPEEEDSIIRKLTSLAVKSTIDGAYNDPYNLKPTEAIMFIIFRTTDDLSLFVNAGTKLQKKFMNQFVQNNYGDFLGCDVVHCYVICGHSKFAQADIRYDMPDEELNMTLLPKGEHMKVYKQEGNEFVEYYLD